MKYRIILAAIINVTPLFGMQPGLPLSHDEIWQHLSLFVKGDEQRRKTTLDTLFNSLFPKNITHNIVAMAYRQEIKDFFWKHAQYKAFLVHNNVTYQETLVSKKNISRNPSDFITSNHALPIPQDDVHLIYATQQKEYLLRAYKDNTISIADQNEQIIFDMTPQDAPGTVTSLLLWNGPSDFTYLLIGYSTGIIWAAPLVYNKNKVVENPNQISNWRIIVEALSATKKPIYHLAPSTSRKAFLCATEDTVSLVTFRLEDFSKSQTGDTTTISWAHHHIAYCVTESYQQKITGLGTIKTKKLCPHIVTAFNDAILCMCPYIKEDYDAIRLCNFSPEQASLMYRLIDDQKNKKKSIPSAEDTTVFQKLPIQFQHLLLPSKESATDNTGNI